MSNIEIFWQRIAEKAGDTRTWHELPLQFQQMVIQGWNSIAFVLDNPNTKRSD